MTEYVIVIAFLAIMVLVIFTALAPSLRDVVISQTTEGEQKKREATISTAIYD